jgi:hypothetical protein
MGDVKTRRLQNGIPIKEDVQIDLPWGILILGPSAHTYFEALQGLEQGAWLKFGFNLKD